MLLAKKDIYGLLRCPKSGARLKRVGNQLIAESGQEPAAYDIIDEFPVLIDPDQSLLGREQLTSIDSVIERRSHRGLAKCLKGFLSAPNRITLRNVDLLMRLLLASKGAASVLIVGGGTIGNGMASFYSDSRVDLVSFDIYGSRFVQFVADAHRIPLPDNYFDGVIIQAVLEHVLEPASVVAEIHRVLKENGIVYAETPFLQHVHEGAYDFTRFTESGHRYLFKSFELISSGVRAGAGTQLLWAVEHFSRGLLRSKKIGKAVKLCFFWLRWFDCIIPEPYNVDAASGVFFMGRKQRVPMEAKDIIPHYKGAQR